MLNTWSKLDKKTGIDVAIASSIMLVVLSGYIGFFNVVTHLLEFIIVLEVVRTLTAFVIDKNHIMSLRYIIDGAIVFLFRELILVFTSPGLTKEYQIYKMTAIVIIITACFLFRYLAVKYSPDQKPCEQCGFSPENK